MPDPLPAGLILQDLARRKWRLGPSVGKGGFGEIYSAQEFGESDSSYPYVVKIEPHANGTLFVEMHFYMKNAKPDDIEAFRAANKLKTFGMPVFWGSGSHVYNGVKYRFIVMDKFGEDVYTLQQNNGGAFPAINTLQLALQMLYVLEYIHKFGYVHADIKGSNILLGATPQTKNQAYLVDFGLATKFSSEQEFKPNPKKAHDGTIEFLSRDAHKGVPTRRGDLEILAFNIVYWLGGKLPWDGKTNPKVVQQGKEEAMENQPKFLQSCFGKNAVPDALVKFLKYICDLKFNEAPNYKKIRDYFKKEIESAGGAVNSFDFNLKKTPNKRKPTLKAETPKKKKQKKAQEETGEQKIKPLRRKRKEDLTKENATGAISKKQPVDETNIKESSRRRKRQEAVDGEDTEGPLTQAMKEIIAKRAEKPRKVVKVKAEAKAETLVAANGQASSSNSAPSSRAQKAEETRPRRDLKVHNYDERTPKPARKGHK